MLPEPWPIKTEKLCVRNTRMGCTFSIPSVGPGERHVDLNDLSFNWKAILFAIEVEGKT